MARSGALRNARTDPTRIGSHRMQVAARVAELGASCMDVAVHVIGAYGQDDLVDDVPRAFVIHDRTRAKLGDGQEAWAREELIALLRAATWNVCRDRQTREVVAWQEAL